MTTERPTAISKALTRNDTGETGGHQAGILIPKDAAILSFFPSLDQAVKNPRHLLRFADPSENVWHFAFIHYNNRLFGGTRNEYRLTCMTSFLRSANLKAGDVLTLNRDGHRYRISYRRTNNASTNERIKLGTSWRVVQI
jgi:hypothetical protein